MKAYKPHRMILIPELNSNCSRPPTFPPTLTCCSTRPQPRITTRIVDIFDLITSIWE